ncbi:DUF2920 family protein [Campylobacter jejuni]|uniref:DUF2920 family protein n=1 Tax=Campylobacter jejuni TaxID=197 RepID=UPI003F5255A2
MHLNFCPTQWRYQNYGIMAAIDHINALKDLINVSNLSCIVFLNLFKTSFYKFYVKITKYFLKA